MVAAQQVAMAVAKEEMTDEEIVAGIRKKHPDACNTKELGERSEVRGFMAPYVAVTRKSDDVQGTMQFLHNPRIDYGFEAN